MERLEHYRQCIRKLLSRQATVEEENPENAEVECQLIFDAEHDHYQLLDVGWRELRRVYNCFIHLDIKDGKIWIQRNMTEVDIARELVEMGVHKEDIIWDCIHRTSAPIQGMESLDRYLHECDSLATAKSPKCCAGFRLDGFI